MNSQTAARRVAFGSLAITLLAGPSAGLGGCGTPGLEVRGELLRTVGEGVVLELVQGDPGFSGETLLTDAGRQTFDTTQLNAVTTEDRIVDLKIPIGITVGPAQLQLGQVGSEDRYLIDLELNRLALATTAGDMLEALPLPGGTAPPSQQMLAGGRIALSPDGSRLVASESKASVHSFTVGTTLKPHSASYQPEAGVIVAMAATNRGAVVATEATFVLVTFGTTVTAEASFAIPRISALAVDSSGTRAVAVSACDTDSDDAPDSDCLTLVELAGTASKIGREFVLDAEPGASQVAIRADGTAAVVADTTRIYGVLLDEVEDEISSLAWPNDATAQPVGIDRAPSELGDIFAIADAAGRQVQIVGFDGNLLKPVGKTAISLGESTPSSLSFGRRADLYVGSGSSLLKINPYADPPEPAPLSISTASPIVSLVVQR